MKIFNHSKNVRYQLKDYNSFYLIEALKPVNIIIYNSNFRRKGMFRIIKTGKYSFHGRNRKRILVIKDRNLN